MKRKRLTKAQRKKIHHQTHQRCGYCGHQLAYEEMQIDHIKPRALGGSDDPDNLIAACRSCNHDKSTLSVEGFRETISGWLDRLARDHVTYQNAMRFGLVIANPKPITFYFEQDVRHEGCLPDE